MSTTDPSGAQEWRADRYATHAGFVAELGLPVLELLNARAGERILDLGCGDGVLAERLRGLGCEVVGVDGSADMVRATRARGIEALVMDGQALTFTQEFDAVFSNAALHWMRTDPAAVVAGVARALRRGGRFVGEFGGHGNVAAVTVALMAVLRSRGLDGVAALPWYFPTRAAYRALLEQNGFTVQRIELVPRPTPLPTGIEGWLETFAAPFLALLSPADRSRAVTEVIGLLRPVLCDEQGQWTADYVRLRFVAALAD